MYWIGDADIQPMWEKNFPHRKDDAYAHAVCVMLLGIITEKAIEHMDLKNCRDKLSQILEEVGVAKDEFEQFQKEELWKQS
jgi:hypothetical protein